MEMFFIGFFSGIISGMGVGGGTILIPALAIFTSLSQQEAQGINLIVFIPASIFALLIHFKNKNIELKKATPLMIWGILGAIGGSVIAIFISPIHLRKIFSVFLFVIGIYELFGNRKKKGKK